MSSYDQFEKEWAQNIDQRARSAMDLLDKKLPKDEIFLRLQQAKTEETNKVYLKEVKEFQDGLLPSFKERLAQTSDIQEFKVDSGFSKLDSIIQGFRSGGTYIVGGLEKSGKSSFLMNILNNLLKKKTKVGYINTELRDSEFAERLTAINLGKTTKEAEEDSKLVDEWVSRVDKNLLYAGVQNPADLKKDNVLSFEKTLERMHEFVREGAKVVMLDNLTTYNTITSQGKKGWEVLAQCISLAVTFAKEKNIILFPVIHTKPNVVFTETPSGIKHIINTDPSKIFEESITITRRPSLNDVYGGGGALSQVSGTLLIWRPYQKYSAPDFSSSSAILMDSFRHAPSGGLVQMVFDGGRSIFTEKVEEAERVMRFF